MQLHRFGLSFTQLFNLLKLVLLLNPIEALRFSFPYLFYSITFVNLQQGSLFLKLQPG